MADLNNYCGKCGATLATELIDAYNTETGDRLTKKVCPSFECGHYGVEHDYKRLGFWKGYCDECKKCGAISCPDYY